MKKAISYLRFSSIEQKAGNSTERQLKAARDYCERNGLVLDENLSIADEGLSGYKGHHVEKGSLGHFLNEVKAGKIPVGTSLIIENLDRLSRQGIDATTDLLKELTKHGIDVHVIALGRVLKSGFNNSLVDYMLIGVQADLAHQESEKKSQRIGSAWNAKKKRVMANGELYTNRLPAWLEVIDGKIVEVTEAKGKGKGQKIPADVVREIFRLAAQGIGSHNICNKLMDMRLSRSWVVQTLLNRAVLGEFKMFTTGDVVPGYFPQVVSQSDFDAARQAISAKRKNGKYIGGNRQRSDTADNLLSGLVWDVTDIPTQRMHFQKLSTGYSYLSSAFHKGQKQNRIRYTVLEEAILRFFENEDWKSVAGSSETEEVKSARINLENVLREIDALTQQVQRLNAALDNEEDVAIIRILAGKIAKSESALIPLASQRDALQETVDTAIAKCAALYDPETLITLIVQQEPEANEIRLKLRAEIRKRVGRIGILFYSNGQIGFGIDYVNGVRRLGMTDKNYKFVLLSSDGPLASAEELVCQLQAAK